MDAMFELRRLRMLHEFALRGTLAAVADALSYSPSTISQQLDQLEKDAAVPLFVADGRRLRLTEHGELLAAYAERALDEDERVRGELEALRPGAAPVRVALMQTAALALLPDALALLAAREPDLRLEAAAVPPEEGLFELSARRFDLVVAEQYPGHTRAHRDGLTRRILGRDPIRLAVPRGDRARGLRDLADRPWVLEPEGTAARQWAVQQCRAAGFEPDVRYALPDLTAHVGLVAAGRAVAMLPDLVWAGARPPVRTITLPDAPTREVFVATRAASGTRRRVGAVVDALADALTARTSAVAGGGRGGASA
jgi:DNA-binding transcriptional LysR family regulator